MYLGRGVVPLGQLDSSWDWDEGPNTVVKSLSFPSLRTIGYIGGWEEWNNVTTFSMPSLQFVEMSLKLNWPVLETVELTALKKVGQNVYVEDTSLLNFTLPALEYVGRDFIIESNDNLVMFSAPVLRLVNEIGIEENAALLEVTFPSLTQTATYVEIVENSKLQSISFPVFVRTVEDGMEIEDNPELTSMYFPEVCMTSCTLWECHIL